MGIPGVWGCLEFSAGKLIKMNKRCSKVLDRLKYYHLISLFVVLKHVWDSRIAHWSVGIKQLCD